jgi:N-sulfoglucosamine sulfohydrolase
MNHLTPEKYQPNRRPFPPNHPLKKTRLLPLLGFILGALLLFSCNYPQKTESPPRPNILFAIADDASFPHMSAYGTTWVNTPHFDRVGQEGLLFMRAYTPNAKCAPSRSCILTGRNSWQLEEAANHVPFFPAKFKTYPEALGENGYFVGYTGKGWAPGNPGTVNGQRRPLEGKAYNARTTDPPTAFISKNDYAGNFQDFLSQRPAGQPFCFWYGSTEPHRRYEFGSGIEKGGKQLTDIDRVPAYWPPNDTVRTDMLDYAFEIEYFDLHLGRMLQLLEEAGELDNTIVIVTSDNGMPFPRAKGTQYELSSHMPLAIMWKNGIRQPGRRIEDFVSFIDFAPTYLELAGLDPAQAGLQPVTGQSLTDIFYSDKSGQVNPARDHVLIGQERHDVGRPGDVGYPIRGIIRGDYLYLHNYATDRWPMGNPETGYLNTDGGPTKTQVLQSRNQPGQKRYWDQSFGKRSAEELYHLRQDPDCVQNLAGAPEHQGRKQELEGQLVSQLKKQGDPRMFGQGDVFDAYPYAEEATRNFYERYMRGEKVKAGWVEDSDFEQGPLEEVSP